MPLATNLDEVYRACDPDKPLSALDERYVDLAEVRGTKVVATTIARRIERFNDGQFYQQLFTGHRGSGKSTELLRLMRLSTDTDKAKIGESEIDYAKKALIREYDRLLRDDEFEKLAWVRTNRRVTGDESYARLLNLRLILEYQNGERWADVHPAVMQIPWVEKRLQNETSE